MIVSKCIFMLASMLLPVVAGEESSIPFVRTPKNRFDTETVLYEYPYEPKNVVHDGLWMAYIDEGPRDAKETYLCIHGGTSYGYLYRKMIPDFVEDGGRVVVPDLFGFGRSDKPTAPEVHTLDFHRNSIINLVVEELDLSKVTLVVQGFGGSVGMTLPMEFPDRFHRLIVLNTFMPIEPIASTYYQDAYERASGEPPQTSFGTFVDLLRNEGEDFDVEASVRFGAGDIIEDRQVEAYEAPFPDETFKVGLRQLPLLVPLIEEMDGYETFSKALDFFASSWDGDTFMVIGASDPTMGPSIMEPLCMVIRGCSMPLIIPQAGNFVSEYGDIVATAALRFFRNRAKGGGRKSVPSEYQLRGKERKTFEFVRTPTKRFKDLRRSGAFPYKPKYTRQVVKGMRMAYFDEGPRDADRTYLCLHGEPAHSYLYRKMIPTFLQDDNARVVAIDLFGFGRSDKPTSREDYTYTFHRDSVIRMIQLLELTKVTLVVQDWGGILGLSLPPDDPERYERLIIMNTYLPVEPFSSVIAKDIFDRPEGQLPQTPIGQFRLAMELSDDIDVGDHINTFSDFVLTDEERAAYDAPFPDSTFKAGALQFPLLLPVSPHMSGYFTGRRVLRFYNSTAWTGRVFMAHGALDPGLTRELMTQMCDTINGCVNEDILSLPEANHFIQESGSVIAEEAIRYFAQ